MADIIQPQRSKQVDPLTHLTKNGTPLARSPWVEEQISSALILPAAEIIERANLRDSLSLDYLSDEALVYLIHTFHRVEERDIVNALSKALLARCARTIQRYLQVLDESEAKDAYREVVYQLFGRILDLVSDRGDFWQVRFGMALKRLTISVFRKHICRINNDNEVLVQISDLAGYDSEDDSDEDIDEKADSIPLRAIVNAEMPVESIVLAREGLNAIAQPYREAFILYHSGWQIEAKDPDEPSLSKYFKKDPRTIQNWLKLANEALERWRGEQT